MKTIKTGVTSLALALFGVFITSPSNCQPAPATEPTVKVFLAATGTIEQLPTVLDGISDHLSSKGVNNKEFNYQPESRSMALDELKQKGGDYLIFLQLDFAPGKDVQASLAIQCFDKAGNSLWKEDAKGGSVMMTQPGDIHSLIETACQKIDAHMGKNGLETVAPMTPSSAAPNLINSPATTPTKPKVNAGSAVPMTPPTAVSDPAVAKLCESLAQDNPGKVKDALKKLRDKKLKDNASQAVPKILPCLANSKPDVVREALKTLAAIGNQDAVPALIPLLTNERPDIIREACRTLAILGNKDVIPSIQPLLTNPRPDVRNEAYKAITKLQEKL